MGIAAACRCAINPALEFEWRFNAGKLKR